MGKIYLCLPMNLVAEEVCWGLRYWSFSTEVKVGLDKIRKLNKSLNESQSVGEPLNFGILIRGSLVWWKKTGILDVWELDRVDGVLSIVSCSVSSNEFIFLTASR